MLIIPITVSSPATGPIPMYRYTYSHEGKTYAGIYATRMQCIMQHIMQFKGKYLGGSMEGGVSIPVRCAC